jgi:hypothetical protein
MIYTFNQEEVNFHRDNLKEALKNINTVRLQVDVGDNLHKAYDILMLSAGALEGKLLQQGKPK